MDFQDVQKSFIQLGVFLTNYLGNNYQTDTILEVSDYEEFNSKCDLAYHSNPWFNQENIQFALQQWAYIFTQENFDKWLKPYANKINDNQEQTVGVVLAGNLPIVGFHDFLSVLISGNKFLGKLASSDKYLLPAIAKVLYKIEPQLEEKIQFTEERLQNFDAIIATGSNNSARYFEYYFGKYPHIIRKNRNGVAVLTGNETRLDIFAEDVFRYFGLGCRNVSKLYVPEGYKFDALLGSMNDFAWIGNHNKYRNNYDYNKSIFMVNQIPHFDNGFVLLREEASIPSPISVVHYEFYRDLNELNKKLAHKQDEIQCIVSEDNQVKNKVLPGQSQKPNLWDYADGVDTMEFLLSIPSKK